MRFVAPPHWPQWLMSIPMVAISEGMFAKMWVTLVFHIWDFLLICGFVVFFVLGMMGCVWSSWKGKKRAIIFWTSKTHDLAVVVL